MTITDAFERYRQDKIIFANQSKRTEEAHQQCLKLLVTFFSDVALVSLTFEMVRVWKLELEKTRSPDTVRFYIIRLRVVLDHCKKIGEDCLDPDLIPVPKRADHVPAFVSQEEVAKLIAGASRLRSKAIISLLYASGIRVGELTNLNRDQIHDYTFTLIGKGNKARLCFFDERTKVLLDLYLESRKDSHPALFISQTGARLSATNVQLVLKLACKNADIHTKVTPHTLRHSFATNLLRNNANLRYVQEMLGHKSISTTMMYTHVVNEDLRAIYKQYHTV